MALLKILGIVGLILCMVVVFAIPSFLVSGVLWWLLKFIFPNLLFWPIFIIALILEVLCFDWDSI